jgi:hypothetical protein
MAAQEVEKTAFTTIYNLQDGSLFKTEFSQETTRCRAKSWKGCQVDRTWMDMDAR